MKILNEITKKYLKLNTKRSLVTLIGIILSGAMISAVTTLAVTFQRFMLDVEISQSGEWEAIIENVNLEELQEIKKNPKLKELLIMEPLSIAKNEYSDDEFIMLYKYSKDALTKMNGEVLEGRMPENENEIVLSSTFFDGKENEPQIGEKVTFTLGKRMDEGYELLSQIKSKTEEFIESEKRTFTVCGKMYRPVFESYTDHYTSGITLLENEEKITSNLVDIGIINKKAKDVYKNTEEICQNLSTENTHKTDYNTYVLAYKGVSHKAEFNTTLYSICAILITVIIVGSVLVIYNSFAISVSERKKQFGMLSSIGATKKQIKRSVVYEAVVLGSIGIPVGILSGIAGIGITLKFVDNLLKPMLADTNWGFKLTISWPSILIAAILIAFTIYLSVIIPAKRASKISPIEAIRQTTDIKVKPRKLRTPKIIRKIFGIQGELALKNLKRSKKRYRTTVISLVISIVLFMATTGFVGYMFEGFDSIYKTVDYDYEIRLNKTEKTEELYKKISNIEKIEDIMKYKYIGKTIEVPVNKLNEKLKNTINENRKKYEQKSLDENGTYNLSAYIYCLDEKTYKDYLKEIGVNNLNDDEFILVNYANLLQEYKIETEILNYKNGDEIQVTDYKYEYDEYGDETKKTEDGSFKIKFAKITQKLPFGIEGSSFIGNAIFITSKENFEKINKDDMELEETVRIKTKDVALLEEQIGMLKEKYTNEGLENTINIKQQIEQMKNLKLIIQIFLYGFIFLISAIGVSNVFNTISTNITLRRREFANLKSIGMTNKQFKQMLDLECIFYGSKALLYGLPLGILVCYLLNNAFGDMIEFMFKIPWKSIIICVIAIYLVVYVTMVYASRKVKKENIIDVIRDDNI